MLITLVCNLLLSSSWKCQSEIAYFATSSIRITLELAWKCIFTRELFLQIIIWCLDCNGIACTWNAYLIMNECQFITVIHNAHTYWIYLPNRYMNMSWFMTQLVHDTTLNKMPVHWRCVEAESCKQNMRVTFVYNLSVDSIILYTES